MNEYVWYDMIGENNINVELIF